ncbi:hypothetical protein B566_EDAN000903 [Ephemera danica]|nr:hypothetical protein B566_EDAN000903 [Ephemera danica]
MQKFSWRICAFIFSIGVAVAQVNLTERIKESGVTEASKVPSPSKSESPVIHSSFRSQKLATQSPSSASTTTRPVIDDSGVALYRQKAPSGKTCTLIRVDALLTFTYLETAGDKTEQDVYLPEDATVSGSCTQQETSFLSMRWSHSFALNWHFAQTPGGDHWYIEKMEVKFNTSEKKFQHFPKKGKSMKLTTQKDKKEMLFPTPMGKSYTCGDETTIELKGSKDMEVAVLLRQLKVQPFIWKSEDFGPEYICSPGAGSYRDERAPLAVGSTLAVVVLLTVTGYGVYRYFKIKKVQYDTME